MQISVYTHDTGHKIPLVDTTMQGYFWHLMWPPICMRCISLSCILIYLKLQAPALCIVYVKSAMKERPDLTVAHAEFSTVLCSHIESVHRVVLEKVLKW